MSNMTLIRGHHALDVSDPLCEVPGRCICLPLLRARLDTLDRTRIGIEDIPVDTGSVTWSTADDDGYREPLLTLSEIRAVIDGIRQETEQ
jgi:hypothetical protein